MTAQTWLITGVSSGFGRHMTEQLLADGARVAGTVRDPDSVADLKAAYGDQLWSAALDVTDFPAVRRVVDEAFAELGRIDVVVNNAGYGLFGAAEELSDEQVQHQIDTNMTGSIQVVRAALPHLRAQGGGRIVQLSTYGGQATHPGASLYHASKWGIEGFMESLAKEVAGFGIGVTIVEPGGARTGFRPAAPGSPSRWRPTTAPRPPWSAASATPRRPPATPRRWPPRSSRAPGGSPPRDAWFWAATPTGSCTTP